MIFRRPKPPEPPEGGLAQVQRLVAEHLPGEDETAREIVVAIAGLLACVAYADRQYEAAEQDHVREALGRIHGLSSAGADAICATLQRHLIQIAVPNPQRYTRSLREHGDRELRCEVLEALLDLAAADGELAMAETELLRRTAGALGLEQDDYLRAQARHRERLRVLK